MTHLSIGPALSRNISRGFPNIVFLSYMDFTLSFLFVYFLLSTELKNL